jgi:hypothetical protein
MKDKQEKNGIENFFFKFIFCENIYWRQSQEYRIFCENIHCDIYQRQSWKYS